MEVRVRSTGAVMLEDELRRWLHETGGPSYETLTPEVMEAIGVDPVFEGPIFTDTAEATAAQQEAAYKAQKDAEQAASVRAARNSKLASCDWTQLADSTADKPAWATYRQSLRDVTAQAGFPWNVTWPVEP